MAHFELSLDKCKAFITNEIKKPLNETIIATKLYELDNKINGFVEKHLNPQSAKNYSNVLRALPIVVLPSPITAITGTVATVCRKAEVTPESAVKILNAIGTACLIKGALGLTSPSNLTNVIFSASNLFLGVGLFKLASGREKTAEAEVNINLRSATPMVEIPVSLLPEEESTRPLSEKNSTKPILDQSAPLFTEGDYRTLESGIVTTA